MRELLRFTIPLFAVGALAFLWANRTVDARVRRERWIKFATYVVIVHTVLFAATLGRTPLLALISVVVIGGVVEILRASRLVRAPVAAGAIVLFALAAAGTLCLAARVAPSRVMYLYIVVAVFDGFSQAGGQLAGRTKLAPAVSPGKSIEGFLIGAGAAIVCAWRLHDLASLSPSAGVTIGTIASVAGLGGDLAASWLKRRAGLKDFGRTLPGHGGVLDRFDSFLAAAAVMSVATYANGWVWPSISS